MGRMEGKTAWLFRQYDGYVAADSQDLKARVSLWDRAKPCCVIQGALLVKGALFLSLRGRLP